VNKLQKIILNHVTWLDWLLPALMTISAVFLGYDTNKLGIAPDSHTKYVVDFFVSNLGWVLGISVICYVIVKIIEATARPKFRKLESELADYRSRYSVVSEQVRNLFDGYLYNLANRLEFGEASENNERISLYIHDSNNTFIPCGRYSANPKYRLPSRTAYPDNEGCISKGWENGWYFDNSFPCPENEAGNYRDHCLHNFEVARNTTRAMKMKSRLYAVLCIRNNGDLFGVLVVESTTPDRFSEEEIKPILEGQNDFLAEMIRQLGSFIPKPRNAADRGL
jgi:hypothetical protein